MFSVISKTLVGEVLPLWRDAVSVFYSLSWLGWRLIWISLKHSINTKVSQKFCNISSYFVFQVFQHLFIRPSLRRCCLMVLCEGPSSVDNVQVLLLGYYSPISNKASSSTTNDPLTLVCLLDWSYLPWKVWTSSVSWVFHIINFFGHCPCIQSFFFLPVAWNGSNCNFLTTHYQRCNKEETMFICYTGT